MAFRIGMLVDTMGRRMEPWTPDTHDSSEIHSEREFRTDVKRKAGVEHRLPWTFLMAGSDAEAAVLRFNEKDNVSQTYVHSICDTIEASQSFQLGAHANEVLPLLSAAVNCMPVDQCPLNWRHDRCQRETKLFSSLPYVARLLKPWITGPSTSTNFRALSCTAPI